MSAYASRLIERVLRAYPGLEDSDAVDVAGHLAEVERKRPPARGELLSALAAARSPASALTVTDEDLG